jgi:hypothetical protein
VSALEPPAEVLLVAVLARDPGGTAFAAVPPGAVVRLPRVGRVVVRGMLAREIAAGAVRDLGPLGTALRRVGLSAADIPRLEQAIRHGQVVVLAAVPLAEARGWGRLLDREGAVSLSARPRLGAWPLEHVLSRL